MNRQINRRASMLSVAILLGLLAVIGTISLVAAQQPSEITMRRNPIRVHIGEVEYIDWTIAFTNVPISYSLTIYDPFDTPLFFQEYPVVGTTSSITGHLDWTVPLTAPGGLYLAEILFFTEEISSPFDSQATVTFLVIEEPTPTPTLTPTPTPTPGICEGDIQAYKCEDKNANGVCREPLIDRPLPDVEICLEPAPDGQDACKMTEADGYARWQNLTCGSYVVTEHLTGPFRGYYPSSPMAQTVEVIGEQTAEITFSNVFPLLPMGVAVNSANDKVYVAFQGMRELDLTRPYPFVAVIDSHTDRVIATLPDIGDEPVGIVIAEDKVYVASFRDGLVSVINSETDQVIKNITGFVNPTWLAADPEGHLIYVADYGDGQVRVIDTTSDTIVEQFGVSNPEAYGPFDIASSGGFAYTTLRNAPWLDRIFPFNPFFLKAVRRPGQIFSIPFVYDNRTGSPHAITTRTAGANTYLYVTYAREPRSTWPPHEWPPNRPGQPVNNPINPTHLTVVELPFGNPTAARRLDADLWVGDFAEAGLVFNPNTNHLLGTYGGGFYEQAYPDWLACAIIPNFRYPKTRADSGGVYVLDATTPQAPHLIANPATTLRVGNSTAPMAGDFWWRNPFDIALNPNNNKVYVTDRCWHDYDNQYDNLFPD